MDKMSILLYAIAIVVLSGLLFLGFFSIVLGVYFIIAGEEIGKIIVALFSGLGIVLGSFYFLKGIVKPNK